MIAIIRVSLFIQNEKSKNHVTIYPIYDAFVK